MAAMDVSVILRLIDELSGPARAAAASIQQLKAGLLSLSKSFSGGTLLTEFNAITDSVARLNKEIAGLSAGMKGATTGAASTASGMSAEVNAATSAVAALAREWKAVGAAARASAASMRAAAVAPSIAAPLAGAARTARTAQGARHAGPRLSGISVPVLPGAGGHPMRAHIGGGNAALAALGAIGYGVYEEAQIEDIAARALLTGQLKVDKNMTHGEAFQKIRDVIQRNASLGGFEPKEVGEAVLGSERQFAGLDFNKRLAVLNTMLPAAMQEARFKETNLKESAESMVGLAHMTGTYDPAKLPELYRKFTYASMITPSTLPEYTRALSYSMPSLVAGMGMQPDAIMFLTAMNQAAGIKSTKAGTWVQSFFGKLMPDTGIKLTRNQEKHNAALREMNLLDEKNQPTWMEKGEGGKTDWMKSLLKLAPILNEGLGKIDESKRLQVLDQVFGKQGGREAGLMNLKEFIGQFPVLAQNMQNFSGGEDMLKQLSEGSPVQKFRESMSDLKNVLMDIGSVTLPAVNTSLKTFDSTIKSLKDLLPKSDTHESSVLSGAVTGGLIGTALGWLVGRPRAGAAAGAFIGGGWGGSPAGATEWPSPGATPTNAPATSSSGLPSWLTSPPEWLSMLVPPSPLSAAINVGLSAKELYDTTHAHPPEAGGDIAREQRGRKSARELIRDDANERYGVPLAPPPMEATRGVEFTQQHAAAMVMSPPSIQTPDMTGAGESGGSSYKEGFTSAIQGINEAIKSAIGQVDASAQGSAAGSTWGNAFKAAAEAAAAGIKIPTPAMPSGGGGGGGGATKSEAPAPKKETRSQHIQVTINAHGHQDPHAVAKAVHEQFTRHAEKALSDGMYA